MSATPDSYILSKSNYFPLNLYFYSTLWVTYLSKHYLSSKSYFYYLFSIFLICLKLWLYFWQSLQCCSSSCCASLANRTSALAYLQLFYVINCLLFEFLFVAELIVAHRDLPHSKFTGIFSKGLKKLLSPLSAGHNSNLTNFGSSAWTLL